MTERRKAVASRDTQSTTDEEEAQGARAAVGVSIAEQIWDLLRQHDPAALPYIHHSEAVEPVALIGLDGWRLLREMFRDLHQRAPTVSDLLERIDQLYRQLRKSNSKATEIHWLIEEIYIRQTELKAQFVEIQDVKTLDRAYLMQDYVVYCDQVLDLASRQGATSVLQTTKDTQNLVVNRETLVTEDFFINLTLMQKLRDFLVNALQTNRDPTKIIKVVTPTNKTPHSFEQLVHEWLDRLEIANHIMLFTTRDTAINVALNYANQDLPEGKRPHPRLVLQTQKIRFEAHRLLEVVRTWGKEIQVDSKLFVDTFTALVQMAVQTFRGRLDPLPRLFDMWASSRDLFAETKTQPQQQTRRYFIETFQKLLRLHVAKFKPVALIPTTVRLKSLIIRGTDKGSASSFSSDLLKQMAQLQLEPPKTKPTFAEMPRTYWFPGNARRNPPSLVDLWKVWKTTVKWVWPPLVLSGGSAANATNDKFVADMLEWGAPWDEIVDGLVAAGKKKAAEPFRVKLYDNFPTTVSFASLLDECVQNPWMRIYDLPSYSIALSDFAIRGKSGTGTFTPADIQLYLRHMLVRLKASTKLDDTSIRKFEMKGAISDESRPYFEYKIEGVTKETALALSRASPWFLHVQYPWTAHFEASAWQTCRSAATLKSDMEEMQKNGTQLAKNGFSYELNSPLVVHDLMASINL